MQTISEKKKHKQITKSQFIYLMHESHVQFNTSEDMSQVKVLVTDKKTDRRMTAF